MIEKWQILKSQLVFDNEWVKIRQDEIEFGMLLRFSAILKSPEAQQHT